MPNQSIFPTKDATQDEPISSVEDATHDELISPAEDAAQDEYMSPVEVAAQNECISLAEDAAQDEYISPTKDASQDVYISPTKDAAQDECIHIGSLMCRWRGSKNLLQPVDCVVVFPFPEENPSICELRVTETEDPNEPSCRTSSSISRCTVAIPSLSPPAVFLQWPSLTVLGPTCSKYSSAQSQNSRYLHNQLTCLLELVRNGYTHVILEECGECDVSLGVLLTPKSLLDVRPAENKTKRFHNLLRQLMNWVYAPLVHAVAMGMDPAHVCGRTASALGSTRATTTSFEEGELEAEELYHALAYNNSLPTLSAEQEATLAPLALRPYQQRAVYWMLQRENHGQPKCPHPLWLQCVDQRNPTQVFYFNPYTGYVTRTGHKVHDIKGGILADEMGLGKTVEVIACILLNQCPTAFMNLDSWMRWWSQGPAMDYGLKDQNKERVEPCQCQGELLWVQCNRCRVWKHTACCGYYDMSPPQDLPHLCQRCVEHVFSVLPEDALDTDTDEDSDEQLLRSQATLLICPTSILYQWRQELERHASAHRLRVLEYPGCNTLTTLVKERGGKRRKAAVKYLPFHLACHDIVLTTYELLRTEIYKIGGPRKGLRNTEAAVARWVESPLVGVHWWRVVMDESQMVEGSQSATQVLTSFISAEHRWCVTGTPIKTGMCDLQGLISFLQLEPFHRNQYWWKTAILLPCKTGQPPGGRARLLGLLRRIMWRTSKCDVLGIELELPPQILHKWEPEFSPVEQYYYDKLRSECLAECRKRELSGCEEQEIGLPLVRLRQVCCHPQVGLVQEGYVCSQTQGGWYESRVWSWRKVKIRRVGIEQGMVSLAKSTMTMADLRKHMISRARQECEEANQQIVRDMLEIAGVCWLLGTPDSLRRAAQCYREVLANGTSQLANIVRVDQLQKLQALVNLHELVTHHGAIVGRSGNDEDLPARAEVIRQHMVRKAQIGVAKAVDDWTAAHKRAQAAIAPLEACRGQVPWYDHILVQEAGKPQSGLQDQMVAVLNRQSVGCTFSSIQGLRKRVSDQVQALVRARDIMLQNLGALNTAPSEYDIVRSQNCPGCNQDMPGALCPHCHTEQYLQDYQQLLMAQYEGGLASSASSSSSCYPSEVMRVLQVIALHRSEYQRTGEVAEQASQATQLFTVLKDEYMACRALWTAQLSQVHQLSELSNTTSHVQYHKRGEVLGPIGSTTKIARGTEEQQLSQYEQRMSTAKEEFQRHFGHLRFLTSQCIRASDECQVCQNTIGVHPVLMPCGHVYCTACVLGMKENMPPMARWLSCPTCRFKVQVDEICYVENLEPDSPPHPSSLAQAGGDRSPHAASNVESDPSMNPAPDSQPQPGSIPASSVDPDLTLDPLRSAGPSPAPSAFLDRCIKGDWGTKLGAVVKLLMAIRGGCFNDPDTAEVIKSEPDPSSTPKTIVFSQWVDVLVILSQALKENGIRYTRIEGSKSIKTALPPFQQPTSGIDVLLLPLSSGAKGLNITEATHVIMVEPLLSLDIFDQAIGRVHRIGQTKKTHVHIFVTKKSIEKDIYKVYTEKLNARNIEPSPLVKGRAQDTTTGRSRNIADTLSLSDVELLLKNSDDI